MKKIILSLAIIAVVGGLVGGATWAYFADQAEVSGNTISTGNVDLEIRGIGWHTTGEYYDAITFDMEWDNIYPGWSDSYDIQFRNESSIDSGLDVIPSLERESGAGQQLRDVITLQFVSDSGQTDTLTLEEWRDNKDVLEHLASSEEGEEWTLKFEFPGTGEDQSDLQNSEEFEFDLVFDGIQAETPINKVTNMDTGETYGDISAAVDAAEENETIVVPQGVYDENVLLDVEGLTLESYSKYASEAIIQNDTSAQEGVVAITADNITLDGFVIDNLDSEDTNDNRAVRVKDDTSGTVITNNTFNNSRRGIQANWSGGYIGSAEITGNTFNTAFGLAGTEEWEGLYVAGNIFNSPDEAIGVGPGVEFLDHNSDPLDEGDDITWLETHNEILGDGGVEDHR